MKYHGRHLEYNGVFLSFLSLLLLVIREMWSLLTEAYFSNNSTSFPLSL